MPKEFVGLAEAAEMVYISKERLVAMAETGESGFPAPAVGKDLWSREDVLHWFERVTGARRSDPNNECSFCGKPETDDLQLIYGPASFDQNNHKTNQLFICEECVDLSASILLKDGVDLPLIRKVASEPEPE